MSNLRYSDRRWIGILVLILILAGLTQLTPGSPDEATGRMRAIDGDSFHLGSDEVRLVGIDAPEGRQTCERAGKSWACGEEARRRLEQVVGGRELACDVEDRDKYGRLLAVCRAGGVDVNRWMVEQGWAVSYGRYLDAERAAERGHRGIWAGQFERPRAWRDRYNQSG
ncbi:MAG: thermonuclease family protein [Hyphomicrobiaceae bacterium]